jgi:hypothetical protein
MKNLKFQSIESGQLARVSGGATRVGGTDQTSQQLQLMLSQIGDSIKSLAANNQNNSSNQMMPLMMMMMMGGGGGGGGAAAAPPPVAAPAPTYVRVNVRGRGCC